ncbi:hypothetical protein BH09BAC1_BH09BAC1_05760 [soil metagenome]
MPWFDALKRYLFRRSLQLETTLLNRKGEVRNYANSRFIGIWFDATDRENYTLINSFSKTLSAKGKKVEVLGFIDKVKKTETILFDYLEPKEVSWNGVPNENAIDIWASKEYDLLLCLHPNPCNPLEYLAMLSQAKCRVGRYSEDTVECYDIMVSLNEEGELPSMIKQVDRLLTEINKNQQQNAA